MQATLSALAGLGFFLSGLHMLAQAIQMSTGRRLRLWVARLTRGPMSQAFTGMVLGTVTQSTSASTFICMGLMHAGALGLGGALVVTAWAPVGTALLVFLASVNLLTAGLVAVGLVGLSQMLKLNRLGGASQCLALCFSAGIMLTGLGLLKEGGQPLQASPWVAEFFLFAADAPVMVLLAGLVLSLLAQSAATVSVLGVALYQAGGLPGPDALWLMVGASLGSGLSVSVTASHLNGWPRWLALWQTGVRLMGAVVMLVLMVLWPASLAWVVAGAHNDGTGLTPGLRMALFYAVLQGLGAVLATGMQPLVAPAIERRLAMEQGAAVLGVRYLYPEATRDPPSALVLAWREQMAWAAELVRILAGPCQEDNRPGALPEAQRHAAMRQWHGQIEDFLQDCLATSAPPEVITQALHLQAGLDTLWALHEALSGVLQGLPEPPTAQALALCRTVQARLRAGLGAQTAVPAQGLGPQPVHLARALRSAERALWLLEAWQGHRLSQPLTP